MRARNKKGVARGRLTGAVVGLHARGGLAPGEPGAPGLGGGGGVAAVTGALGLAQRLEAGRHRRGRRLVDGHAKVEVDVRGAPVHASDRGSHLIGQRQHGTCESGVERETRRQSPERGPEAKRGAGAGETHPLRRRGGRSFRR